MLFAASFFKDVTLDGMNQKSPARAQKSAKEKTSASFIKLIDNISAAKEKQPEIKDAGKAGKRVHDLKGGDNNNKQPSNIAEFRMIKSGRNENIKNKGNNTAEGCGREKTISFENADYSSNAGILVQCVSQILEVKPEDIMFLFESGGVEVQDVFSGMSARDIISELAAIAGLNESETQSIQDIAALLEKSAVERAENRHSTADWTETGADFMKEPQPPAAGRFSFKSGELDMESLMHGDEKTSEKYAGIIEKLKAGFERLLSETEDKPEGMPFISPNESKDFIKQPEASQKVFDTLKKEYDLNVSETEQGYRANENGGLKQEKQEIRFAGNPEDENPVSRHATGVREQAGRFGTDELVLSLGNNEPVGNTLASESEPAGKFEILPQDVLAKRGQLMHGNEILSRIVENARIILDGSKSEMVMQLKPESLGKLSLKVVAEHGIVTAKFIVENSQVKHIIETNMQALKDALEEQGLKIEGLSVSVGQEQQSWLRKDNDFIRDGIRNSTTVVNSRFNISEGADFDKRRRINPYEWNGSRIDLMA